MELTDTEVEQDRNAYAARVAILGVNLGRLGTRVVLLLLQAFGIFARA
jgi:hypothetical protein